MKLNRFVDFNVETVSKKGMKSVTMEGQCLKMDVPLSVRSKKDGFVTRMVARKTWAPHVSYPNLMGQVMSD